MFEGLKKGFQERIEKNAVKLPDMTWMDSSGVEHKETIYVKRSKLPMGDWGRIYPAVNEDGSWNLMNLFFGGWRNLMKLVVIGAIITLVLMGFNEIFTQYEELRNLPCVQLCLESLK